MKPKQIIKLRQELGLTQGGLAECIGVSRETVNRWETGKHPPEGAGLRVLQNLLSNRGNPVNSPRSRGAASDQTAHGSKPGASRGRGRKAAQVSAKRSGSLRRKSNSL